MEVYNLPFFDLPGITSVQDLADPAKARLMGQTLFDRWRQGDTTTNLAVTSLVTNAFLITGDEKYRAWVVEYTDAWVERAQANGGMLPDNVGLSGEVGEYCAGNWYGGRYGWTFPHGFLTLQKATLDAAANAYLLTRDRAYLDLPRPADGPHLGTRAHGGYPRPIHERGRALGEPICRHGRKKRDLAGALPLRRCRLVRLAAHESVYPVTLWNLSMDEGDWERMEAIRQKEAFDWAAVFPFHNKEDSGHEAPWVRFLAGANPTYPEQMLQATYQVAGRRLAQLRADQDVGTRHHVHHWQWGNPVSSEALIQLTMGGPQPIYNGGLLYARLRYFDAQRRRPGLPEDVGALVEKLEANRTVVRLVNLNHNESRELVIQGGAFGEHSFGRAAYHSRTSEYPGWMGGYAGTYAAPPLETEERQLAVDDKHLSVTLPPHCEITLDLETQRYVNEPSHHAGPF